MRVFLSVIFVILTSNTYAACTTPAGSSGDMNYYSSTTDEITTIGYWYCNDTVWVSMKFDDCLNVGDLCLDGSIYAGDYDFGYGTRKFYTADQDQSTAAEWKNATGTDDIVTESDTDGLVNHANRVGDINDFEVMKGCEDLNRHSQTDWYLPSKNELNILHTNKAAIDVNATNFSSSNYWSSSEEDTSNAWRQNFGSGTASVQTKTNSGYDYRCIRREIGSVSVGACTTAGEMYYDITEATIVWCDGSALWPSVNVVTGATCSGGCLTPTAIAGALDYDTTTKKYRVCNGNCWLDIVN